MWRYGGRGGAPGVLRYGLVLLLAEQALEQQGILGDVAL